MSAENISERQKEIEFYRQWKQLLSPTANREFLREFGSRLIDGMELSGDLRFYLGIALIDIGEGKSIREAFNMHGKGRPKDSEANVRNMRIAIAIAKQMNSGISLEDASYSVSEDFNVSEHTAIKAYKDNLTMVKSVHDFQMIENWLNRIDNEPDPMVKQWLYPTEGK